MNQEVHHDRPVACNGLGKTMQKEFVQKITAVIYEGECLSRSSWKARQFDCAVKEFCRFSQVYLLLLSKQCR